MHHFIEFLAGACASTTGGAAITMYFIADRLRFDPENYKVHRNTSIILGLGSLFFFTFVYLWE